MAAVGSLVTNAIPFVPYGNHGDTLAGREVASATYIRGTPLVLNGGRLDELTINSNTDIVGIAAEPATGTTDAEVLYWPATPDTVFVGTLEDDQTLGHAIAIGDLYTDYSCETDDDGIWFIDFGETGGTNVIVVVVGLRDWLDMTAATVRTRVLFRFLADVTIYNT